MADIETQAKRLREEARGHMRAARRHRRRARERMAELDQLIAAAAQQGIRIQITPSSPREGGPNGNQQQEERRETGNTR